MTKTQSESDKMIRELKAWLLSRQGRIGYDEYEAKVVVAHTDLEARRLANQYFGDEGPIWEDSSWVTCEELDYSREHIVLEAFKAG